MADNTQLNLAEAPLGDTISTDDLGGGSKVQRVKVQEGVDGSAADVHDGNPLPTIPGMSTPTTSEDSSTNLAVATPTDLDSTQINSGLTGKLASVLMAASVPLKGELKTVLNGVESSVILTMFSIAGGNSMLVLPNKDFVTQAQDAGAGFDGFRLTVTNLDNENAADVYATFFYDEE